MGDKSTKNVCHNFQCLHVRIAYLGKKSSPLLQPPLGPEAFELPYTCNMVHLLSPNYRYNVKLADSYCQSLKTCCLFPDPFTGKLPNMISGCLQKVYDQFYCQVTWSKANKRLEKCCLLNIQNFYCLIVNKFGTEMPQRVDVQVM